MNYKTLPAYGKIIYITIVVYILTQLWKLSTLLFCWSGYSWGQWLALPSNLNDLVLKPWAILTYMFCHADLSKDPFHIVFNMLWLWWFGQFFMRRHSAQQMVAFYLTSGIASGLFFVLCYNIFPYFRLESYYTTLVGASGAIFALIVAVAMRHPEEQIGLNLFVKIVWLKMKWFALIVIAISLLCFRSGNDGGIVCHIGGALFGLLYGWAEKKGTDITALPLKWYNACCKWMKSLKQPRMTATRGGRRDPISADKKRDMDYNTERRNRAEQIDAILDKISRSGYDALTEEEKRMLFDASQRNKRQ